MPRSTEERSTEEQEWVEARIESWVETYKKSMLTPVILSAVAAREPATVAAVAANVAAATGWTVTERSLYRSLKRLQDTGFLLSREVDAARTGAKRKELTLTRAGAQFLAGVEANMIVLRAPGSAPAGEA
ncbi:helix-turn-helix transcriptional regulator [Arthrobacter sp. ATA002]|uniref:helix-turn-helix transcriptional regulator n=1 Tax=Arthrobacter sp. ATA002 TaxID=2991715 RepID=UPI0022A7AC49|nr:helix-turn-helix transcriptional regulator [Arthrobacter sp. ATA002]WAP50762.1 helix-turn-helix transcriptional regulator [Arthrobacter sp. ATA002]